MGLFGFSKNSGTGFAKVLFMEQTSNEASSRFIVKDEDDDVMYHLTRKLPAFHYTVTYDGEDIAVLSAKGNPLKPEFSLEMDGEEVIRLKRKSGLTSRQYVGDYYGEEFILDVSTVGRQYEMRVGDYMVARVDCIEHGYQDRYCIRVLDEDWQDVVVALAVLCDREADKDVEKY